MGESKTILITGIDGFLGSHLFATLSENYCIIGIERDGHVFNRVNDINHKNRIELYAQSQLEWVFSNRNIDFVIHTATHHANSYNSFTEVFSTNVDLGLKLLHFSSRSKVKCFFNMDTILSKNINLYSYTKAVFRESAEFLSNVLDMHIVTIKMDMIYGPNAGSHNFIQQMINYFLENSEEIKLTEGIQKRSFLFIEDIVSAINIILMNYEKLSNNKFTELYLTHPILNTIREVMLVLKNITNSSTYLAFGAIPYRDNEIMETETNDSMLKVLNWSPKYSLEEGLIKTLLLLGIKKNRV